MSSHGISAHKKIRNMESYDIIPMLINPFIPSFPKSRQMGNITRKSRIGLDMDVLFEVVEAGEGGDGGITPEEAGVLLPLKTLFIANFHGLPLLIIRDRSFFGLIKSCLFICNPKYLFVPRE